MDYLVDPPGTNEIIPPLSLQITVAKQICSFKFASSCSGHPEDFFFIKYRARCFFLHNFSSLSAVSCVGGLGSTYDCRVP